MLTKKLPKLNRLDENQDVDGYDNLKVFCPSISISGQLWCKLAILPPGQPIGNTKPSLSPSSPIGNTKPSSKSSPIGNTKRQNYSLLEQPVDVLIKS